MDVNAKIDELIEIVESARAMPMSASCVINRAQVLDLLDDLKRGLPEEMDRARRVLADRESVLEDGRREAERLLERTRSERESIIGNTDVSREARGVAERIVAQARQEAEQIRVEAEDYVDQKLANFEVVLTKTLQAVGRGRDKMRGSSSPMDELGRHVEEQDLVQEERRRSRDFSGGEDNQFESYETQDFTAEAFSEADRPYEHSYEQSGYPEAEAYPQQAPSYADQPAYADQQPAYADQQPAYADQQSGYREQSAYQEQPAYAQHQQDGYGSAVDQLQESGYSYEQGAYDQGAAHGYGTGEFHTEPQNPYGSQGYEDAGYGQPQQHAYAPVPHQQQPQQSGPPPQYPAEETSYFDTGLIDVRQFQHDGYSR